MNKGIPIVDNRFIGTRGDASFPASKIINQYGIFFILALALGLRLFNLNSPLIGIHAWRQTDTAAIARNYFENNFHFLYPRIDWGGNTPGFVETEFPLYPFSVALLYRILGVGEFLGRALSVCCYLVAIYGLFLLVKKIIDYSCALWASLFMAILPLSIFYIRAFMPESALLMSSVLGIYFFSEWVDRHQWFYFFLSAFFTALAVLIKIPTLYIGLPLLFLAWQKYKRKTFLQYSLYGYSFLVLIPVGLWYFHAHQIFLKSGLTFGIWGYGVDKWGNWDLVLTLSFWKKILFRHLAEEQLTWVGFPLFLVGLFNKRSSVQEWLFDWWLLAIGIYIVIVAKGNYVHNYYQLPYILPVSVYMGKTMSRFSQKNRGLTIRNVVLLLWILGIATVSLGRYHTMLKEEDPKNSEIFLLAEQVKARVEPKTFIIAVDRGDPTLLYLSHRKGWQAQPGQINPLFLKKHISEGAVYLIGLSDYFKDQEHQANLISLMDSYPVLFNDGKGFILNIFDPRSLNNYDPRTKI